ncbi:hypothetical protein OG792_24085 [Micromonospora sp. NBC_01699]|uniref:hypothetical protein n=1 Tax=Micromonospora sp. NBC_01699 TaxID=2975984 RepID=UPI002E2A601D|nr:hypothetical protein [Micromonospora sp. NBC_01699]
MSRQDEPLTKAGIWWAVRMTLQGHVNGRRCPQCMDDHECRQLEWAIKEWTEARPTSPVSALLAGAGVIA